MRMIAQGDSHKRITDFSIPVIVGAVCIGFFPAMAYGDSVIVNFSDNCELLDNGVTFSVGELIETFYLPVALPDPETGQGTSGIAVLKRFQLINLSNGTIVSCSVETDYIFVKKPEGPRVPPTSDTGNLLNKMHGILRKWVSEQSQNPGQRRIRYRRSGVTGVRG